MPNITQILARIEGGDSSASAQLLPLVYDELRKLAAAKLANEKPGQTLQATALVHEAYLRLVDANSTQSWNGRGHFFAAAAEAMRRILVDQARHKQSLKAGGQWQRVALNLVEPEISGSQVELLDLHTALEQLEAKDFRAASVVKLRFFAGLTMPQIADALDISLATAENDWSYAKSWLRIQLDSSASTDP